MTNLDGYIWKMASAEDRTREPPAKRAAREDAYYREYAEFPLNKIMQWLKRIGKKPLSRSAETLPSCKAVACEVAGH
jgi:hypothetical protein